MPRVFDDWRRESWRPSPKLIRQVVETTLILLLALQAARLTWLLATPAGPMGDATQYASAGPARAVDLTILQRFDPFFRVEPSQALAAGPAPTEGGLSLFGVRTNGRGGGSAILGTADGAQALYALGDDVGNGMVLRAVAADHVILTRGGSRIRLEFSSGSSLPPPPPPPPMGAVLAPASAPVAQAPSQGLGPSQFLSAAALSPVMADGRVTGYRVMARGRGEALARAGLQDGDVLLAVDGSNLNPERLSELPDLLAKAADVEVRFARNGQPMTTRLRTAPQ
ncbi:type II secretion system protein N [Phenylobacterium sp.]|uniref:type II secretion system protein N n=1 Tax=Phenylobacterium sp. TaxID=1871053 RepID=UPI00286E5E75|nr:type II secretion system protein N [Phenylobacterium sp.]